MYCRYIPLLAAAAVLLAVPSCVKEPDPFEVRREPSPQEQIFGSELEDEQLLKFMNIKVSEELALTLEAATAEDGRVVLDSFESLVCQGVVGMRRLFPHAGRFEARTREEGLHLWYVLEYEEGKSMTKASDGLAIQGVEIIEYCPRIAIVGEPQVSELIDAVSTKASSVSDVFNDPMLPDQWHYYNTGSASSSVSGCDINVVPVWKKYSTYSRYTGDVIVGIVDEGVDYAHEDLKDNMWHNPEKTGDNVYGYNFAQNTYNIHPGDHGTHVAGTVAAVNNNGIGVCGVAGGDARKKIPGAKIMSCQIFDGSASGGGAEAIKWSADHGAVISQNSWGYPDLTTTPASLITAIDYFEKHAGIDENGNQTGPMRGGLVIFAAGNEGRNTSSSDYEKILAVASVGADYKRAYYTCYGDWCDVIAPGGDAKKGNQVISTLPGDKYGKMQGTSMACPHVSGLAALALARFGGSGYTPSALRKQIESNVTDISSFNPGYYLGKGLINAYRTVAGSGGNPPAAPTDLDVSAQSNNIHFSVNVPSDSDDGTPTSIYIYYSKSDFTSVKNRMFGMFYVEDLRPGDMLTGVIGGTEFETDYYVAAMACDLAGNMSSLSPRVNVKTGANSSPVIDTSSDLDIRIKAHEKTSADFVITEPDGHFYTIVLDPGSEAAVLDTVVRNTPKIRLTPSVAAAGKYEAEMTVTDIYGLSTSVVYRYEILENHRPVVARPFEDMIFDSKAAVVRELDASEFFTDEDGEELSYTFEFSRSDVANMTYSDGRFQVTSMNYGVSEIKVTGTDVRGESVSQSFRVLVRSSDEPLTLYPNPVRDELNIRVGDDVKSVSLKLLSALGNIAFEGNFTDVSPFEPVQADLSAIAAGSYVAVVTVDGTEYRRQIVKL